MITSVIIVIETPVSCYNVKFAVFIGEHIITPRCLYPVKNFSSSSIPTLGMTSCLFVALGISHFIFFSKERN